MDAGIKKTQMVKLHTVHNLHRSINVYSSLEGFICLMLNLGILYYTYDNVLLVVVMVLQVLVVGVVDPSYEGRPLSRVVVSYHALSAPEIYAGSLT